MAQLNITINIPDQVVPEVVAAIESVYGGPDDKNFTAQDAQQLIKRRVVNEIKKAVAQYRIRRSESIDIT